MTGPELETARLRLRPIEPDDVDRADGAPYRVVRGGG